MTTPSDTPRTNALTLLWTGAPGCLPVEVARQLERELAAAKAENERLVADFDKFAGKLEAERDQLRAALADTPEQPQ